MNHLSFLKVALDLETAGLLWKPEVGDEVSDRKQKELISVLVDPKSLSLDELRAMYLWLPSVEQIVYQFEARQAILFHAGLELTDNQFCYKTVIKAPVGPIETKADSLRLSLGIALRDLLLHDQIEPGVVH